MDPFSAEGELLNIHNSFHQGQYQEVIDFDTSKLSPDNTIPAQVLKWRAQIANGQAKSVIDKLAKGNDSPDTAAVKAFALYTLGKSTEAQEGAEKLAATSADNATVQLMAGTVLQAVGKPEEALTLLSKHQGSLEAIALIVQIHLQQNRTDLALKEVTAARKWAQDNLLVNIAESWVGLRVGGDKYQQAFYVFEEMAQTPSTSAAKSLVGQAVAEIHLGRLPEAEAALQQAIEKDPENVEAIANSIVLNVLSGKDVSELTSSLQSISPEHALLTDVEEKSLQFDQAAAKYSVKINTQGYMWFIERLCFKESGLVRCGSAIVIFLKPFTMIEVAPIVGLPKTPVGTEPKLVWRPIQSVDYEMSPAYYTEATRAPPRGSYGPITRFVDQHGLPRGRRDIYICDVVPGYAFVKQLNTPGALNEGICEVEKFEGRRAGQRCILKRIAFTRGKRGRLNLREIEILQVLKHPNIVKFIDGCIPRGPEGVAELYIEYCDRGSLQGILNRYIRYNKDYDYDHHPYEYIPEAFLWELFRSMASALAYLHFGVDPDDLDNPPAVDKDWPYILHRDIKPDNILLKSTPSTRDSKDRQRSSYPTVVLADFGVCTQQYEDEHNPNEDEDDYAGTFVWQGPEFPQHTTRGEVWTLGVIMMSLCNQLKHGPVPLKEAQDYHGRDGIRDAKISGEYYSKRLRKMIRKCLRIDRERRPLSNELLGDIRETEEEVDPPYEPLPDWVFKKRRGG